MYDGRIPFIFGCPVPYVRAGRGAEYEWRDNEEFEAELKFKGFHRGRSAAHAIYFKMDDPEWEATMFITDLKAVIEDGLAPLYLTGRFVYTKRGQNYGIKLIDVI